MAGADARLPRADVAAAEKWLLEHMPFYGKWYRFWLFWMLTDGIYEAVKADPTWNGGPDAVSAANAMHARDAVGGDRRRRSRTAPDLLPQRDPELSDRRQAHRCATTASGSRR